jgi:DNA-directed RNA polymerase specialized sigma54-like protein
MRAKTYERVVGDVLAQRPNLATALDPTFLPAVKIRDIAEHIGMHESTITRVAGAVQFRTLHGLWAFEVAKGKLSVRNCAR